MSIFWPCGQSTWIYGFVILVLIFITPSIDGLAIDNEVIGIPQVQCSEDAVTFAVRTRNPFNGNIYIKGKFNEPSCRQEFFSNTFNGASYTVRIPLCGMRRIRQLQPQGMNYILVFVVNFHPQFNTKIDRAYNVRCFYAQQEKTVTSQLEVSMLSTQSLEAATMLMPNCEYSIRSGSINGPRVRYVRVGDRLVHRWECDNPNFGMLVKNCFVNDGYGSSVRVLDSRGCPVFTPVIQGPLQYDNNLDLAYVEVWAYKFPDRQDLYFQCQIQVCNKRENECVGVTPPNCPLLPKPPFTPQSIIDPAVTGPYGPVTYVRGTFERPFPVPVPGQPIVAPPYGVGSQQQVIPQPVLPQQVLPQPAPYGPPFGQQVVPGFGQYLPGVQPSFGQQQVLGVPYPGVPGIPIGAAASDEGANAGQHGPIEAVDQQAANQSPQPQPTPNPTGQPPFTPGPNFGRQHPNEFNADVRNDDSQAKPTPTRSIPATSNRTFFTRGKFRSNTTQSSIIDDHASKQGNSEQDKHKSRREADHDPDMHANTRPMDPSDESVATTSMSTLAQGDVHLMDVTAEMVYVSDVGDNDAGDDLKHYPFATISVGETKQICLNPLAFSLLFSCFAILVIIIALLLIYLLIKSGRWSFRNRGGGHDETGGVSEGRKWLSAGTLSTNSSISNDARTAEMECKEDTQSGCGWTAFTDPQAKKNKINTIMSMFTNYRLPRFNRQRLQAS